MRKVLMVLSLTMLMTVSVPSSAATQTVTALAGTFVPPMAISGPNDTIKLQNSDALFHTLTVQTNSPLGGKLCRDQVGTPVPCSTGIVFSRSSGSFTLTSAPVGTYRFFCELHLWMQGTLVVR